MLTIVTLGWSSRCLSSGETTFWSVRGRTLHLTIDISGLTTNSVFLILKHNCGIVGASHRSDQIWYYLRGSYIMTLTKVRFKRFMKVS